MLLKDALAGAFRAIRAIRGLDYEDLAEVSAKATVSAVERGTTHISLHKLDQLSAALEIDPLALLALCYSSKHGETTEATLARVAMQLEAFKAAGGEELLSRQFEGENLVPRPRGKPMRTKNKSDVLTLKAAGLSQSEVAQKLGLPTSTVGDYWTKE